MKINQLGDAIESPSFADLGLFIRYEEEFLSLSLSFFFFIHRYHPQAALHNHHHHHLLPNPSLKKGSKQLFNDLTKEVIRVVLLEARGTINKLRGKDMYTKENKH